MRQVMEESELLQIITAVDEDAVKRLLDVYRESMDQLVGGFESPAAMEREYGAFLREFVRCPGQLLLVEQAQERWVSALRTVEVQPGQWFIEAVETAPQNRGKGWGKALMLHAVQELERRGVRELFSLIHPDNGPSIAVHEAVGFVATGRAPVNGWGEREDRCILYALRPDVRQEETAPCI